MAEGNGTQPTLDTIEQAIEYRRSVKKDDYATGTFNFVFPAYGFYTWSNNYTALPPAVPAFDRYGFTTPRDKVLLMTPNHEAMWANTIAIATTKAAAWGWEVDSSIPLRRKRAHQIYQTATAWTFTGWIPFIYAHIRSFLLTGRAIVEIERETTSYYSKVVGLHHLSPIRCRFTDNPREPVEYLDRHGNIHKLQYWQCMIFVDQTDPTEGEWQGVESAAMRTYPTIARMEAVERYLYEKVTGKRPLSLEFIQGITSKALNDAIKSSDADMERTGSTIYRGVVAVPIPGDIPITRVSIPIAEIPDAFKYQELHDNAAIDYADSTGLDVNDLDPRLAQRMALGSGAQAVVLAEKAKGKGLAAWRADWTMQQNMWVLDTSTTFAFSETTIEDEIKKAQLQYQQTQTADMQIKANIITNLEARNLLVDGDVLPPEFLQEDMTEGGTLTSVDKPEQEQDEGMTTAPPPLMMPRTPQEVAEEQQQRFDAQREDAKNIGQKPQEQGKKTEKHLLGQHDQSTHAHGGKSEFYKDKSERVWQGTSTGGQTSLSKLETGAIGEKMAMTALSKKHGVPFDTLNVGINNAPIDVGGNHTAAEVKTGLASADSSSRRWRATIGQPGKKEAELLKQMSPEEKTAYNAEKNRRILERKNKMLGELSDSIGEPVKGITVGVILSPDGKRGDVFMIPGFHLKLNWTQYAVEDYYYGTIDAG